MKTPILFIGDGVAKTGLSRVIHSIINKLPKDYYDIHHLAVNYYGDPHLESWKIYPASSGKDHFGVNRIKELQKKINPKITIILGDLWVQKDYLKALRDFNNTTGIISYIPIDSGPVDPEWVEDFEILKKIVVFTEYAKNEIKKELNPSFHSRIQVIPHGIDTRIFYPHKDNCDNTGNEIESGIINAKKRLGLFDNSDIESSFLVLNANRNQPRKRIDLTIKGFSEFARNKPINVKLYLHMGFEDKGWNVLKLAQRHGIDDRLVLTNNNNSVPSVTDEVLNLIYNACDVGINTSSCEGWGLPSFEHAATKKAQVVPRCFSLAEIWRECAEFIEPSVDFTYEGTLHEGKLVNSGSVANALEKLYSDKHYRETVANACYNRVIQPEYNWENIGKRWHRLIQEIIM